MPSYLPSSLHCGGHFRAENIGQRLSAMDVEVVPH
jgi:hypothetical protein